MIILTLLVLLSPLHAEMEWFDKVEETLTVQSSNGWFRAQLSGLADLETYYVEQPPPGLIFDDDSLFFNPRLSLFLDTHFGPHVYSLIQARLDRGFDPMSKPDGDVRLDEYLIRYTPFEADQLNVQAGKFATVIGNWVPRHDSWKNPFITAPLPYDNVLVITDRTVPPSTAAFLARRTKPDQKQAWLPLIWGPSYATGVSVFGLINRFEYAFELKNAALSSRPEFWEPNRQGWSAPTVSGRIGYRPNAAWNVGANFSRGSYLSRETESALPAGKDRIDFNQTTLGPDISFAWRHWEFFGELYASRFEAPAAGDADTVAYYLETKYEITPRLFTAMRWNQQLFGKVSNGPGSEEPWDRDIWRIDTAVGYRLNRHMQAKLQYSYNRQRGTPEQGDQLIATQLTLKF